jgi:hypothetical protein
MAPRVTADDAMFGRDADRAVARVRVLDAVAHFAQNLPYRLRCSDDLDRGLSWAPRGVALLHAEIAPDPPGWRTALRFDIDCPCDRQPHAKRGYCPRAATFWREVALPEPSFIVTNPRNGHAHYVYLLAGWVRIDGANAAELAAVRYLAAIERAYTRTLRADPGYASLVQHNPFSTRYTTIAGRDEPYSLGELASFVELASSPRRRAPEIRTDGRNIETFDRLRFWAYANVGEWRCGTFDDWSEVVNARALTIAALVRSSHAAAAHPFTDAEVLDIAKSVAGWVWLRYDGANPTIARARAEANRTYDRAYSEAARRARGAVARETYLGKAQARRERACALRAMGLAVDEIARHLGAGIRSVYRWIAELRSVPRPSGLSDFAPQPRRPELLEALAQCGDICDDGSAKGSVGVFGAHVASIEDRCEYAPPTQGVELAAELAPSICDLPVPGRGGRLAYIQRRISELIARSRGGVQRP